MADNCLIVQGVNRRGTLTPQNQTASMGWRADRCRIRAPNHSQTDEPPQRSGRFDFHAGPRLPFPLGTKARIAAAAAVRVSIGGRSPGASTAIGTQHQGPLRPSARIHSPSNLPSSLRTSARASPTDWILISPRGQVNFVLLLTRSASFIPVHFAPTKPRPPRPGRNRGDCRYSPEFHVGFSMHLFIRSDIVFRRLSRVPQDPERIAAQPRLDLPNSVPFSICQKVRNLRLKLTPKVVGVRGISRPLALVECQKTSAPESLPQRIWSRFGHVTFDPISKHVVTY